MKESRPETITTPPKVQKLERLQTIEREHKDALERAVSLNVPHAFTGDEDEEPLDDQQTEVSISIADEDALESSPGSDPGRTNWDEVVKKLFKKNKSENLQPNNDTTDSPKQ